MIYVRSEGAKDPYRQWKQLASLLLARQKETGRCLHSGGSGFHAIIN